MFFLEIEQQEGENGRWQGMIHFDAGYALAEMRAQRDAPQTEARVAGPAE